MLLTELKEVADRQEQEGDEGGEDDNGQDSAARAAFRKVRA